MRKHLFGISLVAVTQLAHAQSWESKQGLVSRVVVNAPSASARNVIVWLEGVAVLCSLSSNNESAYFNRSDTPDTFNVMVTSLMMAKAMGKTVTLLTTPGTEGCRIDRVQFE